MPPFLEESMMEVKPAQLKAFHVMMRDEVPVVIDTGASYSLTPFKEDFVGPLNTTTEFYSLQGLSSKAAVCGEGTVEWSIQDIYGITRTVRTKAYFVPSATIRLFSPQTFFQEHNGGELTLKKNKAVLKLPDQTELEFPFNPGSNLPLMLLAPEMNRCGLENADAQNFEVTHVFGMRG